MAQRFYLIPIETIGTTRLPKYLRHGRLRPDGIAALPWSMKDFGNEDVGLVCAEITDEQHTSLSSNIDVVSIPANLDNSVSAIALNVVRDALEGLHIPGNWVTTSHTYRQVTRTVALFFDFMQRVQGLTTERLFSGRALSATWGSLPAGVKQVLRDAATAGGLDYSFVTSSTTIREILLNFAGQWGSKTILIGGVEL